MEICILIYEMGNFGSVMAVTTEKGTLSYLYEEFSTMIKR